MRGTVRDGRFCISHGSDVNLADKDGRTASMHACQQRHVEYCQTYDNSPPSKLAYCVTENIKAILEFCTEAKAQPSRPAR